MNLENTKKNSNYELTVIPLAVEPQQEFEKKAVATM